MNRKRPEKKPGTKEYKLTLPDEVQLALKVLAAKRRVTMSEYSRLLISVADVFYSLTGIHLIDDPSLNPAPPIAQLLKDKDLQALSEEIQISVERLEAIAAGDRPTDMDLSFLVAADCIPYTINQLFHSRQLQFDRPQETKNAIK